MAEPAEQLEDPYDEPGNSSSSGSYNRNSPEDLEKHRKAFNPQVMQGGLSNQGREGGESANDLRSAEQAGAGSKDKGDNQKAESPDQLAGKEKGGYSPFTDDGKFRPISARNALGAIGGLFWGNRRRRGLSIGGASVGLGGILAIVLLSISAGPIEFIHIDEILTSAHFGHIHNAGDERFGKLLFRTMKGGKVTVGDTRLNYLEQTFKNQTIKQLVDMGITPEFEGPLQTFKGFTVDTTNPASPFFNQSSEEAIANMEKQLGGNSKLNSFFTAEGDTKFFVQGDGIFGDRTAIRGMVKLLGKGTLSTALRARVLRSYTLANFHPIHILKKAANQTVTDLYNKWNQDRLKQEATGQEPISLDDTNAKEQTGTDKNGNPITEPLPGDVNGAVSADKVTGALDSIRGSGAAGLVGKAAGVIGLASLIICSFNSLYNNIAYLRYVQVIVPMMRMGMEAITVGEQIKSDQDVDIHEIDQIAQQFTTIDAKTHKITSTWDDAKPLVSARGGSGGTDINQGIKDSLQNGGEPNWLAWAGVDPVKTFCSQAVQLAVGGAGIVLGIVTGGLLNVVVGVLEGLLQGIISSQIVSFVANFIAGKAVDVAASGAEWGNLVDYGSRLAANQTALGFGGVALSNQQTAELDTESQKDDIAEFQSHSLAYRLFNTDDYRSLVGSMIDNLGLSTNTSQNFLTVFGSITSIGGQLLKMPATLLSTTVHAANPPYQYPFPEFGFSEEDLNSDIANDDNNDTTVGNLLDNNNQNGEPDYIQKAQQCFGVVISDGNQGWQAVPTPGSGDYITDPNGAFGLNVYDPAHYSQADCQDSGDQNWLRIRFWIFDSGIMEGWTCYLGDTQSCIDSGFTSASTISSAGGTTAG